LWKGSGTDGYGRCKHEGRTQFTHRVAYQLVVGPIPEGKQLDHVCRVRACCNPDHLRVVSCAENLQLRPKEPKATCINGHDRIAAGVTAQSACRQCLRDAANKFRRENPVLARSRLYDWRERNREHMRAYAKAYRQANPEKVRQWNRELAARRLAKRKLSRGARLDLGASLPSFSGRMK
jgi:hypothetical protein